MDCEQNVEFCVFVSKPRLTIKGYPQTPRKIVNRYTFTLYILPRKLEYAAIALYVFILPLN